MTLASGLAYKVVHRNFSCRVRETRRGSRGALLALLARRHRCRHRSGID